MALQAQLNERKNKMKEYVFTGIWSYSCYANSEDEAFEKFNDCYPEDIYCNFDNIEVEEIEEEN